MSSDVSVIIPAHNAGARLSTILETLLGAAVEIEPIVVDDGSDDDTPRLLEKLESRFSRLVMLRHAENRGAGHARNTGFAAATGRYALFFDADDIVHTAALDLGVKLLDETGADLAMFPYRYRRGAVSGHESMNHHDLEVWRAYLGDRAVREGTLYELPELLGFTNYPWNKIVRTDRYQDVGLRFGSTPVSNDILGHWWSLLFARHIVLPDSEICTHIVEPTGSHLSNRHDRRRLTLFDALDETYDLLRAHPDQRRSFAPQYWGLVVRVATWARERVPSEVIPEFDTRVVEHLTRIDLGDFARLRRSRDSRVADEIVRLALA